MRFSICFVSCPLRSHLFDILKIASPIFLEGAFEDEDVTHVEGEVNPVRDCEIISEELRLKDQEKLEKDLDKLERACIRGNDKKLKPEYDSLVKIKGVLVDEKKHIRFADWSVHDVCTEWVPLQTRCTKLNFIVAPFRSTC